MSGEPSRIAERAGVVAAGTLASRVLGALRDAFIAALFPVLVTDVFWLAFVIPNSLRVILAEGAMSGALVPSYAAVRERDGVDEARRFFARFTGTMLVVLVAVAAFGMVFADGFVWAFASGYADRPETHRDAIETTRVVFPYIVFMGLAALGTGALQSHGRFAAGAFAPALLNLSFLALPFLFLPLGRAFALHDTTILACAALAGGLLQCLALVPALASERLLVWPRPTFTNPDVKRALALLLPMLLGLGVYQLNVAISRQFLSHLPDGSMSFLYYAQRLVEIPQGMFALAVGSAVLPAIARAVARGERDDARKLLGEALRMTWFVAVPSSVALAVLAGPIVSTLFGHGRFDSASVAETAGSLVLQSIGIFAISAVRTVVPMFHGMRDTRAPIVASAVNLVVFAATSWFLVPSLGHRAVALALSLAGVAQFGVLALLLRARGTSMLDAALARATVGIVVASALAGIAMTGGRMLLWAHVEPSAWLRVFALAGLGLLGGATYLFASHALGLEEGRRLVATIRRRTGGQRVA